MSALYDFDTLYLPLEHHAKLKDMHYAAPTLLRHILVNGDVPRGDVAGILGTSPRLSRVIMTDMLKDGIIGSTTARGALSLRFLPSEHDLLFPRLFIGAKPFHRQIRYCSRQADRANKKISVHVAFSLATSNMRLTTAQYLENFTLQGDS